MKIIFWNKLNDKQKTKLLKRPAIIKKKDIKLVIQKILKDVKKYGDKFRGDDYIHINDKIYMHLCVPTITREIMQSCPNKFELSLRGARSLQCCASIETFRLQFLVRVSFTLSFAEWERHG